MIPCDSDLKVARVVVDSSSPGDLDIETTVKRQKMMATGSLTLYFSVGSYWTVRV